MSEPALQTREDYLAALDTLLSQAAQLIRIKDADLRGQGWDAPARPAMLEAFLQGGRARRVEILLHTGDYLVGHCPLLMNLLRHYGHQLEIRVHDDFAPSEHCYVLGDGRLLLYRHHWNAWRGRYAAGDRAGVGALTVQFEAEWARIAGGLGYTPLGL